MPPPQESDLFWKNRLYEDEKSKYGFAVSIGHLKYLTEWYYPSPPYPTKTVIISHVLKGDNYSIRHIIYYYSPDYFKINEKRIEALSDDL